MSATAMRTFKTFQEADEKRDVDGLLGLLTDDAVFELYDREHPPSKPMRLEGKSSVEPFLRDIYGREMTHKVSDEVIGEDRFACLECCEYPDGNRVVAEIICQLREGQISREILTQAGAESSTRPATTRPGASRIRREETSLGERPHGSEGFSASRQRVEEMLGRGRAFGEVERFIRDSGRSREERDVLWVLAWLERRRHHHG